MIIQYHDYNLFLVLIVFMGSFIYVFYIVSLMLKHLFSYYLSICAAAGIPCGVRNSSGLH